MDTEDQQRELLKVTRKVHSRGSGKGPNPYELPADVFKEPTLIDKRSRFTARKILSVSDKIQIVHQVLCQFHKQADVAREFRVTI